MASNNEQIIRYQWLDDQPTPTLQTLELPITRKNILCNGCIQYNFYIGVVGCLHVSRMLYTTIKLRPYPFIQYNPNHFVLPQCTHIKGPMCMYARLMNIERQIYMKNIKYAIFINKLYFICFLLITKIKSNIYTSQTITLNLFFFGKETITLNLTVHFQHPEKGAYILSIKWCTNLTLHKGLNKCQN